MEVFIEQYAIHEWASQFSVVIYSVSPTESLPLPITPDYGGPSVCYADGVFDSRFGRYVTVREGKSLFSGAYFVTHTYWGQ